MKRPAPSSLLVPCVAATLTIAFATSHGTQTTPRIAYEVSGTGPGTSFSNPRGIFFDTTHGECYVADTGNSRVVIYDRVGMPIFHFIHYVTRNAERVPGEPKGIVVTGDGMIFLTDNLTTYIDVLDHRGRSYKTIDVPDDGCGAEHRFEVLALGTSQRIYASMNCANAGIALIDAVTLSVDMKYLRRPDAERYCITGMAVSASNEIYVTDPCGELQVQVYDANGDYLRGFGRHDHGRDTFSLPTGVAVQRNGSVWIVDTLRQVASCFTPNGEFITRVGGKGRHPGAFEYPVAVATEKDDRLYVLERSGNRYQCFEITDEERKRLAN